MIDNKYHFEGKDKAGKPIIIDLADLSGYGDYEIIAMRPKDGQEIEVSTAETLDEAIRDYENYIEKYALKDGEKPPLTGKYAKLRDDLIAAYAETEHLEQTEDGGTCNFDAPVLHLERWNAAKIMQAAEEAGGHARRWTWGKTMMGWIFSTRSSGQGSRRTRRAEAISEAMKAKGYDASMYYQAD